MSRQSTKGRNRLTPKTLHAQTIVLHHMRRKYTNAVKTKSKNRFVDPTEHEHEEDLGEVQNDKEDHQNRNVVEKDKEGNQDQEEVNNDQEELNRIRQEIDDILDRLGDDDDDDDAFAVSTGSIDDNHGNADDVEDEGYFREDEFEAVDDINALPELPDVNDPKYPQEDAKYFGRKNYVRNDKYELSWFFEREADQSKVVIPQLIDVFNVVAGG
jgi:hypothetical protein